MPPLTWLYVPADRPDRVEKALASGAHAVIVDLEDAVAPWRRPRRGPGSRTLSREPRGAVYVRVNARLGATIWRRLPRSPIDGVLVPKVESAGLPDAGRPCTA